MSKLVQHRNLASKDLFKFQKYAYIDLLTWEFS